LSSRSDQLPTRYDLGGIVGWARLSRCLGQYDVALLPERQRLWFFGPFGFQLEDATPRPFRAVRGQLGLFEVPDA
jgi:hypothetical protein